MSFDGISIVRVFAVGHGQLAAVQGDEALISEIDSALAIIVVQDGDVAAVDSQPAIVAVIDIEAVAVTTGIERHRAAGDVQMVATDKLFGVDRAHARAGALGVDVERVATESTVVAAVDGERLAVADDEVDDFSIEPDSAAERDTGLDDIRARAPFDVTASIRRHTAGHFGVVCHGLRHAVHVDVRHGVVLCPRRYRREQHHEQHHRRP